MTFANPLSREIASNSQASIAISKELVWRSVFQSDPVEVNRLESRYFKWLEKQPDFLEGITSFLEVECHQCRAHTLVAETRGQIQDESLGFATCTQRVYCFQRFKIVMKWAIPLANATTNSHRLLIDLCLAQQVLSPGSPTLPAVTKLLALIQLGVVTITSYDCLTNTAKENPMWVAKVGTFVARKWGWACRNWSHLQGEGVSIIRFVVGHKPMSVTCLTVVQLPLTQVNVSPVTQINDHHKCCRYSVNSH